MLKIDQSFLRDVGLLELPRWEQNAFLRYIYETLEQRVGLRLANQMTSAQLDEFEAFVAAKDDSGAFQWLESKLPNYKVIVNSEFDQLKSEITRLAAEIMSISIMDPVSPGTDSAVSSPSL